MVLSLISKPRISHFYKISEPENHANSIRNISTHLEGFATEERLLKWLAAEFSLGPPHIVYIV